MLYPPIMRITTSGLAASLLATIACTGSIGDHPGGPGPGTGSGTGTAADAGVPTADAPPPITPGDPGAADVHVTIDSARDVHAISPFIYGHNDPDWTHDAALYTLARSGGNRLTAYNWENNASNAGTDWYNENDSYLGDTNTPGKAMTDPVAAAHAHGAAQLVTVPILGYVAADKDPPGDVNQTPNFLATRFKVSKAKKGSAFTTTPDTSDAFVYQDEFVAFLEGKFPESRTDARRTIFYDLDNEPDLWSSTHPRIHPDPIKYQELIDKTIEYAEAIKAVAPAAKLFGFVSYGWAGFVGLQGAPDANNRDFIDTFLDAMHARDTQTGKRPVDVLDLHWYPEAQGGGQRIIVDDASAAVATARVQAPRSLWDPSYTETSWITQYQTQGPIKLIPRMRDKIAAHYPGTQLAFSEYYYGGGADISGGVAEADALGVFGREGLFEASLWHVGSTDDRFIKGAFAMFRTYDGAGAKFGDTSIHADTDHVDQVSAYASLDAGAFDRMVVVLINRSTQARSAGLTITHGVRFGHAEVWRLTSASPTPAHAADVAITATNAFVASLPPMSVTTLVLRP
jgi:Glycoside hydrolase family 44